MAPRKGSRNSKGGRPEKVELWKREITDDTGRSELLIRVVHQVSGIPDRLADAIINAPDEPEPRDVDEIRVRNPLPLIEAQIQRSSVVPHYGHQVGEEPVYENCAVCQIPLRADRLDLIFEHFLTRHLA